MNTKPIPVIITLTAALISCIMSIFQHVEFQVFVSRLLIVVLIFLFMGTIIKMILDYSFRTLEPTVSIDDQMGAVVPENAEATEPEEDVETTKEDTQENSEANESEEG
ncbi:MAG: hypothetical protein IJ675_05825 [Pseudobutyrivibrio sp.]|nr:hypothetical protein [Pseudobutyrivibrio sp.]